jgi:hypothetical protein
MNLSAREPSAVINRLVFCRILGLINHLGLRGGCWHNFLFYFWILVLRGRPLENLQDLPTSLRPLTLRAIEAAPALLRHFIEDPASREGLVGIPLYLHSMITFAVVFLVKISHWWHVIGITIDPSQHSRPLIGGVIKLL